MLCIILQYNHQFSISSSFISYTHIYSFLCHFIYLLIFAYLSIFVLIFSYKEKLSIHILFSLSIFFFSFSFTFCLWIILYHISLLRLPACSFFNFNVPRGDLIRPRSLLDLSRTHSLKTRDSLFSGSFSSSFSLYVFIASVFLLFSFSFFLFPLVMLVVIPFG